MFAWPLQSICSQEWKYGYKMEVRRITRYAEGLCRDLQVSDRLAGVWGRLLLSVWWRVQEWGSWRLRRMLRRPGMRRAGLASHVSKGVLRDCMIETGKVEKRWWLSMTGARHRMAWWAWEMPYPDHFSPHFCEKTQTLSDFSILIFKSKFLE